MNITQKQFFNTEIKIKNAKQKKKIKKSTVI